MNQPLKRRARRIAADEAHAWARNLRLGNPGAKLVLSMLTQYVNGDGHCFVGISALSEDCEMAPNTIRSRLKYLEEVGVISRFAQYIDELGRRNGEGRGKRTSDEIRLLMGLDEERLEAQIAARGADPAGEISPSNPAGLNSDVSDPVSPSVSPSVALQQPFNCVQGLTPEPEPEPEHPSVPSGERENKQGFEAPSEPPHWAEFWAAYPGHEAMDRGKALQVFSAMTQVERERSRAAVPLFAAALKKLGRTHVPNPNTWLSERRWEEFPAARLPDVIPSRTSFEAASLEGRAIKALYEVARCQLFEHRGSVVYPMVVTPRVLAFAEAGQSSGWLWIEDRQQIAAWSTFVGEHVHRPRGAMITTRGVGEAMRHGILAPWPWPPRKDGTLSPADGDEAAS